VLPSSTVTNSAWSSVVGQHGSLGGQPSEASLFSEPMTARRFPPPWSVEELDACFVVRD
jgi:hypothetical protein